jgi:tyrosyl-tRNA synthetase
VAPETALRRSSFLRDLGARHLLADISAPDDLDAHLASGRRTAYVGFDPTADSLHIGSLLPLLTLRRLQCAGHRPIVLIGGGTGLIGDPSGKAGERQLNPLDVVGIWAERLKRQVAQFVDFDAGATAAILVDNYEWLSRLEVIPFLRDIGKHFSVGAMIARESVRARLGRADAGISFTEFAYQVLQAYDFLELSRRHDCSIQLGGTDQWGNITAGIDLIRRVEGAAAYGITLPLVTKSDGTKFGKTETGTVWLDPARTSPYAMYQYWLNTADADVVSYLRSFTFLEPSEIDALAEVTREAPEKREGQRVLAREVTRLVHGAERLAEAERITAALFSGEIAALTEPQLRDAFRAVPTTPLAPAELPGLALVDLLARTPLAGSKRRARELVSAGSIHVNGQEVRDPAAVLGPGDMLYGRYLVLRRGKRHYQLVTIASESPVPAGGDENESEA